MKIIASKKAQALVCSLMVFTNVAPTIAFADGSCTALIQDLVNWNATSEPGFIHRTGFTLATSASPARWVGTLSGMLVNDRTGGMTTPTPSAQLFSDRLATPEGCTGFCFETQPFAIGKADQTSVAINASGELVITLNTWGNAVYKFNPMCTNGFMHATQGDGFHVLSFKKAKIVIPR